jgi:LysR family glycine cleavage system transcriptional activator
LEIDRPRSNGPHLNALRAFEAAARHQSFVAAAEELHVTPGAVSQHVKTLEAWAETKLFDRHAHGVTLTDAGQTLLPIFVTAFDGLAFAIRALRSLQPVAKVHIATFPSIAQLWLPKRLNAVRDQVSSIQTSVTTLEAPPNLCRELFDIAILSENPVVPKQK